MNRLTSAATMAVMSWFAFRIVTGVWSSPAHVPQELWLVMAIAGLVAAICDLILFAIERWTKS
jgi:hypothetical protein